MVHLFFRRVSEKIKYIQTAFAEEGHSFAFLNKSRMGGLRGNKYLN